MHLHRRWKRALTLHRVAEVSNKHLRDGIVHRVLCAVQVRALHHPMLIGVHRCMAELTLRVPGSSVVTGHDCRSRKAETACLE
eukprot:3851021-Rhodomonas_salina.1